MHLLRRGLRIDVLRAGRSDDERQAKESQNVFHGSGIVEGIVVWENGVGSSPTNDVTLPCSENQGV